MLINAKKPKATGEIIEIALVNEEENIPVKIKPNKNMESITPAAIVNPKKIIVLFGASFFTLFAK